MACHGSGGIIQNHQCHFRLIVHRINHPRNGSCKEGRISHKGKTAGVRLNMAYTLSDTQASSHTQTGIHHIQRHSIAHGITANISTENSLTALHGLFYSIEGSTMWTACAKHWRTYRQLRCRNSLSLLSLLWQLTAHKGSNISQNAVSGIFTGIFHMMGQLAQNLYWQMVFACNIYQFPLNNRIQLLYTENLLQACQELHSQLLWKWMRGRYLQFPQLSHISHGLCYIGIIKATGGNTFL